MSDVSKLASPEGRAGKGRNKCELHKETGDINNFKNKNKNRFSYKYYQNIFYNFLNFILFILLGNNQNWSVIFVIMQRPPVFKKVLK